jgi:uncharacterized protein YehS (DUF1456 family)
LNNNDILRRLRYTFNFNDKKMVELFASAGTKVTREQISQWLKKDDVDDFASLVDEKLAAFLNGFINEKRGKKSGEQPSPEKRLSNNIILTKLKIALDLRSEQLIELLISVDFRISKPELSAFTRKVGHKHFRECKDQVLRNLLQAIDKKYHVHRTTKVNHTENEAKKIGINRSTNPNQGKKPNVNNSSKTPLKSPWVEGARPNASGIYINPKVSQKGKRTQLKLSK